MWCLVKTTRKMKGLLRSERLSVTKLNLLLKEKITLKIILKKPNPALCLMCVAP